MAKKHRGKRMAKLHKARKHKARRGPSGKAKAAYSKLLVKAYKRFQPGGKGYQAIKQHNPSALR